MAKKPKSANSFYFNNDTEAMRKANNALDRRGIPSAKRTKYITEMDIKSLSKKTKPYKKPTGSMDKDLRQFAKPMPRRIGDGSKIPKPAEIPNRMGPDKGKVIKPYKGPRVRNGGPSSTGKKPTPSARKQTKQEALKKDIGPMGSTAEQRIESQKKMLSDMRQRMMLRKKKGQ